MSQRWNGLSVGDRVIYTGSDDTAVIESLEAPEPDGDMAFIRFDSGGSGRVFTHNLSPLPAGSRN